MKNEMIMMNRGPVAKLPAAVFTKTPAENVSSRYVHIPTWEVVDAMKSEGFEVFSASDRRTEFGRHIVRMSHPDAKVTEGLAPMFIVANSHNGSSAMSLRLGAYRQICSNGLVVGTTYAAERVRHSGDAARDLIERAKRLARNTAPLFDSVKRWSRIELTDSDAHDFARLAAQLRYGDAGKVDPGALLEVRRSEDAGNSLWAVYNRVQEATTNLKLPGMARSGRQVMTRALGENTANTGYNALLWDLAEEFAHN